MEKVIGIDLGGTSIYGGVLNKDGEILKRGERTMANAKGQGDVLNKIGDLIEELMEDDILGIGIGSPGFIDSNEGKVLGIGGNIQGWAGTDIRGQLSKRFSNYPIFVENDANIAALCEKWIGAAKDFGSFLMITLGTGVGGAIYTEKEGILTGYKYQGAELGHAILYPKGNQCNCGQKGCAERYVSGRAIERIYAERTGEEKKGKDIFKDSINDKICKDLVEEFAEDMGIYLVSLKNIFDPQGVVIGGGVINSRKYWWDKMIYYYKKHSNDPNAMKIVPAAYLNDSGMIGAGKVVFDKIKSKGL
ncbi:ROK family protein [Wansuia hejianensis]|uniref:ROK family protein n=1 Tax=Wansuia hejianensis TaxID=2763667 RepID=A0A926ILH5_9FIRM|nr:ROK family protein [Wansuia hejianensis]MBC8589561.1 ROK family protein [Wansuia hejianensis]